MLVQFARQIGLKITAKRILSVPRSRQMSFILRKAKRAFLLPPEMTPKDLLRQSRQYNAHIRAAQSYVTQSYPGLVTFFRGRKRSLPTMPIEFWAGTRLPPRSICTWSRAPTIACSARPQVRALAEVLRPCLPNVSVRFVR